VRLLKSAPSNATRLPARLSLDQAPTTISVGDSDSRIPSRVKSRVSWVKEQRQPPPRGTLPWRKRCLSLPSYAPGPRRV